RLRQHEQSHTGRERPQSKMFHHDFLPSKTHNRVIAATAEPIFRQGSKCCAGSDGPVRRDGIRCLTTASREILVVWLSIKLSRGARGGACGRPKRMGWERRGTLERASVLSGLGVTPSRSGRNVRRTAR